MRRFLAGTVLLMLLLLGGRLIGRAAGSIPRNDYRRMIKAGGQWLVGTIWTRAHPGEQAGTGQDGDSPYQGIADPDPSYRKYQTVKTFYQEHQYLAWYGNEETGQQSLEEPGSLAASGQGDTSGKGDAPGKGNAPGQGTPGSQAYAAGQNGVLPGGNALQASETLTGTLNRPVTGNTYVMEQLADYDFLMKHFYSVHTSTTAGRDLMDAKTLLGRDMSMKGDNSKPQILIYHTHSQEAFADSGPGQTVVGVGDYLTKLLEDKGYNVYHDKSVYDLKNGQLDRSKAYNYALDGITNILQQNPSIEVVLDLHRDGVAEGTRLVTEINGKPTAKIMFFNGTSQTPDGLIEYLPNPNREANLAFSFQMQLKAAGMYPGFTRKIYLKGLRYNQHVRARSALIEVGAQTNTYEEARNAMEPLAHILDQVLRGS